MKQKLSLLVMCCILFQMLISYPVSARFEQTGKTKPLSAPLSVSASVYGESILVKWNAVEQSNGYNIYRSSNNDNDFQLIGNANVSQTTFSDPSLVHSFAKTTVFYYKITALGKGAESDSSKTASIQIPPKLIPQKLDAAWSSGGVNLNWPAQPGVRNYKIYRSSKPNGGFKMLTEQSAAVNTNYTDLLDESERDEDEKRNSHEDNGSDKSFSADKIYYYAYSVVDQFKQESPLSDKVSVIVPKNTVNAPASLKADLKQNIVGLKWTKVDEASGYNLYRSSNDNRGWTKIYSGTSETDTLYTDQFFAGKNFSGEVEYAVKAVSKYGLESRRSANAEVKFRKVDEPTHIKAALNADKTQVELQWTPLKGIKNYRIYRSVHAESGYVPLGTATVTGSTYGIYTDLVGNQTIQADTTYYYEISSLDKSGYESIPSLPVSVLLPRNSADTPGGLAFSVKVREVALTWNASANSVTYSVYRAITGSNAYELVSGADSIIETSYTDQSLGNVPLAEDLSYDYTVVAYNRYGTPSEKSAPVTVVLKGIVSGTRIEDFDHALKYTGNWFQWVYEQNSGGTANKSYDYIAGVEMSFTGNYVKWVGVKEQYGGMTNVYVDGQFKAKVDTYSPDYEFQASLYSEQLPSGYHTIRLERAIERNPSSLGANISLDYFEIQGKVIRKVEEGSTFLNYSGIWNDWSYSLHSADSAKQSNDLNAGVSYTFKGTSVAWFGEKGPWNGIADIYLDNQLVQSVDTYDPSDLFQMKLFQADNLDSSVHTLKIVLSGKSNAQSQGPNIVSDYFLMDGYVPNIIENDSPLITYTNVWTVSSYELHSSGTAHYTNDLYAAAEMSFVGTEFEWYGTKGPWNGIAYIYLDDQQMASVDTYADTDQFKQMLYRVSNLPEGIHKFKVLLSGTKSPASLGPNITTDFFVTDGHPFKIVDSSDASVVYTGIWSESQYGLFHEGSAKYSWYPDAGVQYTFTGTSIKVLGYKEPWGGKQSYWIDGQKVGVSDNYAENLTPNIVLFSIDNLTNGNHQLQIQYDGHNPNALGANMIVDAFIVPMD